MLVVVAPVAVTAVMGSGDGGSRQQGQRRDGAGDLGLDHVPSGFVRVRGP